MAAHDVRIAGNKRQGPEIRARVLCNTHVIQSGHGLHALMLERACRVGVLPLPSYETSMVCLLWPRVFFDSLLVLAGKTILTV